MSSAAAASNWVIQLENLFHFYGKQRTSPSVHFQARQEFRKSEITLLVGESGSGKSTLLKMLGGLDCPGGGSLRVHWDICNDPGKKADEAISRLLPHTHHDLAHYRRHRVAFLFQDGGLIEEFSVLQNVLLPLRYAEIPRKARRARCEKALARVGLDGKIGKRLDQLSGGERHRVAMARTIARKAAIVICDEPTAALDRDNAILVREILRDEARRGACVFIATHDERLIDPQFADNIIDVKGGVAALRPRQSTPDRARQS